LPERSYIALTPKGAGAVELGSASWFTERSA
jgi:hypothetical protein